MREELRLTRAAVLLVVALGVLAGGWIALGSLTTPALLWCATLASVAYAAAGFAFATLGDPSGRRREFIVFAGVVVGTASAMIVGGTAVLVGLAALVLTAVAPNVRRSGSAGRFAVTLVVGLPLMYGALTVSHPARGVIPWTLGVWIQLVRELVDDMASGSSNGSDRRRTLAVALALGFVPVSLLLPARAGYGGAYFVVALFAQLAMLVVATSLIVGRMDRLSLLLKGAMAVGLVALVAGRVAVWHR